jgi:signal peptidase I
MENLKKKFEHWNSKYLAKKSEFEKKAKKSRGKNKRQLDDLLGKLENYSQNIKENLEKEPGESNVTLLKSQIKKFKKTYKQLSESVKPEWRQWLEALVVAGVVVFFLRNFFFAFYHVPTGSAEVSILVGDRICGNNMAYRFGRKPKHDDFVMFLDPTFKYDKKNSFNYYWQKYIGFSIPLLGLKQGPDNFVKRVIAIPGDTIEGRVEDGKTYIYLNGQKLDEPYLNNYPLIGLEKNKGFLDLDHIGMLKIPDFLRYKKEFMFYSYDPNKDYNKQPFYNMKSSEVVTKPGTLLPWLKMSRTPSTDNFGRVVDNFGPFVVPKGKYWVMGDSRKNSQDSRYWFFLDEDLIYGRASFVLYSIDSVEPFWLFEFIKHPIDFWTKDIRLNRFFKKLK